MKRRDFFKTIIAAGVAVSVPVAFLVKPEEYQFCIEAQRLFDAMIEPPEIESRIAIDVYIRDLKKGGVWEKMDHFYRFDAGNEHDALINWVNPGVNDAAIGENARFDKEDGAIVIDGCFGKSQNGNFATVSNESGSQTVYYNGFSHRLTDIFAGNGLTDDEIKRFQIIRTQYINKL